MTCDIRPVAESDLEVLDATFRSEYGRTHADDLQDHLAGIKTFLVAWVDAEPAGHVFVNWDGPRQKEPANAFPDCPEIHRLGVLEAFRHRGIAAALIEACEAEAVARGVARIGLGTDPGLPEESNLYYRLGYADAGLGIFKDVYKIRRETTVVTVEDDTRFLVKELAGS